jgi:hypothetical protein
VLQGANRGASNPLVWFKEQGRKCGVRPVFATQYLEQLHDPIQASMRGYHVLATFGQSIPEVAEPLAADMGWDGGEWTAGDIMALPRFTAAVRAYSAGRRMSAFTVQIPDWEADKPAYTAGWAAPAGRGAGL